MFGKKSSEVLSEAARAYHELRAARAGDAQRFYNSIVEDMHTLDAKSTGLITFISLVLASLTFALSLVDSRLEYAMFIKGGLLGFIGVFALAAWFNLRCLEMSGPPFTKDNNDAETQERHILCEVAVRRYNYFISLRITRSAFALLIPFVIVWLVLVARELNIGPF
jgi:hypothetical protein